MLSLLLSCALAALPQDPPAPFSVPLAFERHSLPGGDCFVARVAGHSVTIDAHGAMVRAVAAGSREHTALGITFVGGAATTATGEAETPCKVNCFLGNDPTAWRTGIPTFERVRLGSVWPGIDVVWHGRTGSLEYDFVVAPGADPAAVRLRFQCGALRVDTNGDLVHAGDGGEVRHRAPVAWQRRGAADEPVAVRYELGDDGTVSFVLGERDPVCELVIDPVIHYFARLDGISGTGAEQTSRIAVDAQGQAIVAFYTSSPNMPTQNPLQATPGSPADVFVAKFNAAGTGLVFATYLGGNAAEGPGGVAVLPNGDIAIACTTGSTNYPLRNAAFPGPLVSFSGVAGVTVLSPAGALVWSTYYTLATTTHSPAHGVATDAAGNVVICGLTSTSGLPMGGGGWQPNKVGNNDAYVARFSAAGTFLGATYYGLTGVNEARDVEVAPNGNICVAGRIRLGTVPILNGCQPAHGGGTYDAWIAVFDGSLSQLLYATYVGGSNNEAEFGGEPLGIAVDAQGRVVLASATQSSNLPVTAGAWQTTFAGSRDGFVTMVDPALVGAPSRVFSTYLGGSANDGLCDVALDTFGNIHVGGGARSTSLPYVHQLTPPSGNPSTDDGLLAVLSPDGSTLRFASSLGSEMTVEGVAIGPDGSTFVTGTGTAFWLPVTPGAFTSGGASLSAAVFAARVDVQLAQRSNYGAGHPGTLGVPSFDASANPIVGTTFDLVIGTSTGLPSLAILVIGTIPVSVPTTLGGTLLVGNPIAPLLTVTMTPSGGLFPLTVPNHPSWLGVDLFAQTAQLDPGASDLFAFSAGLALQLGI